MILLQRKACVNLKSRIEDSDDTHQNHQTGRKKRDDEFQRVCEMKGAEKVPDAEEEKKKGKNGNQDHFTPPEA